MTILIKNILLLNGTRQAPIKADVLVRNDKIAAIGYFPKYKADEIIDGLGTSYLAPGFIDVNSYSDLYLTLFSDPLQEDFLGQGVTTIIGGQGGISLAPLIYVSLSLHKFWADPYKMNIDWNTVEEFLEILEKRRCGVNYGTLAGHLTIRRAITGDEFRDLSQKELEVFKFVLDRVLKDGAFGVSFDLGFPLTSFTSHKELKEIVETAEKHRAISTFKIKSGISGAVPAKKDKEDFNSSVNEIINLSKETGGKIHINNFICPKGFGKIYEETLNLISENAAVADISFNLHTLEFSTAPIFSFLPSWVQRGGLDEMVKNLNEKAFIEKVKKGLPLIKSENIKIFQAPGFNYLIGKSLKDFSETRSLNFRDSLIELMRLTKMRAVLAIKNTSLKRLPEAISHDKSIISASCASFGQNTKIKHKEFNFNQAFLKFLEYAVKAKILSIEQAIEKMTSLPAKQFGVKNRGFVRENYFADLVLFRDFQIETVIVNGKIAFRNGQPTGILNGNILRKENV